MSHGSRAQPLWKCDSDSLGVHREAESSPRLCSSKSKAELICKVLPDRVLKGNKMQGEWVGSEKICRIFKGNWHVQLELALLKESSSQLSIRNKWQNVEALIRLVAQLLGELTHTKYMHRSSKGEEKESDGLWDLSKT